jgi:hypothetical protein
MHCPKVEKIGVACDAEGTLHQIVELTIPYYNEGMSHVPHKDSMPNYQG